MNSFVDSLDLGLQAGHGGCGAVSFFRQRNHPRGAADGGNGGTGGSVRLVCKANLKTLSHFHGRKLYCAENGVNGSKANRQGRRGRDLVLEVPPGTVLTQIGNPESLVELQQPGCEFLVLHGGRGGRGNAHFSSSRLRSPRFCQPGEEGEKGDYNLELKLLADVALVGFPNAGKSYLQTNLTNARPRIAAYPFSTKVPNLGVLRLHDQEVVLADIPGILAGAASGVGLGQRFLAHITRSTSLVLLVDLSDDDFLVHPTQLLHELNSFSPLLSSRCALLIATKLDLDDAQERLKILEKHYQQWPVLGISNVNGIGLPQLQQRLLQLAAN